MEIINNQRFIMNYQLEGITNLLGEGYRPERIIVFDSITDYIKFRIKRCFHITEYEVKRMTELQNGQNVKYMILCDTIKVLLNYKKEIKYKEEKQANLIYDLVVELRRRYCLGEKMKEKHQETIAVSDIVDTYEEIIDDNNRILIYKFASDFMNQNAEGLSVIMNWKERWTFEGENYD